MYVSPFLCSEEGNQATAKLAFGFTRAYNEKIRSSGAAALRSRGIFESVRGMRSGGRMPYRPVTSLLVTEGEAAERRRYEVAGLSSLQEV